MKIEKVLNEPEFIILQDGSKLDLKEHNFVLLWNIGCDNIVTANFEPKHSIITSNLLYRTSLAVRLYDLGIEWNEALCVSLNQEQEASAILYKMLKDLNP